jgi:hypothetical protein
MADTLKSKKDQQKKKLGKKDSIADQPTKEESAVVSHVEPVPGSSKQDEHHAIDLDNLDFDDDDFEPEKVDIGYRADSPIVLSD